MRILDPSREKIIWVGSILVLLLLTLFPFTSPPEGMMTVIREGNRSYSFWTLRQELPILNGLAVLLFLNIILGLIGFAQRYRIKGEKLRFTIKIMKKRFY